jgi:long-chain acyl-CoA synthetase
MTSFYNCAKNEKSKKIFLQANNSALTYGELLERMGKMNRLLASSGLSAGDRVLISSDDDELMAILFLALIDNGMTPIVTTTEIRASEFEMIWQTTGIQGCIMDEAGLQRCCQQRHEMTMRLAIKKPAAKANFMTKLLGAKKNADADAAHFPAVLGSLDATEPPAPCSMEQIAYILMTSGSTSNPKAVPITRGAMFAHLDTLKKQWQYSADSRLLNLLPLHHTDGLIQGPVVACFSGATWVRPFRFSIQNIEPMLLSFYRYNITHAVFVPTILSLVARLGSGLSNCFDYEGFRFLISAAGYLEKSLWVDFEQTFNVQIANIYGLTETVTGGIFCGPDTASRRIGSIGKPVDCEARIMPVNGAETAAEGVGELLLRGDNVFSGYIGREGVNEGLFTDGWLRTGDLAHIDEDGFFHIVGRIKNVVICGGENIYPEEIAEVLAQDPQVIESVCFGVEHREWGEILVAVLVLKDGYSLEEHVAWCGDRLSHFKIPKEWMVVSELPRGPSGKVLLPKVKEAFSRRHSGTSSASSHDLASNVFAIAAEVFHVNVADLNLRSSPENTVGWDSLAHVNFILALESRLNIQLSTQEIMGISCLQEACDVVAEKVA